MLAVQLQSVQHLKVLTIVFYCIDGVVIAALMHYNLLRSIVLPRI